MAIYTMCPVIKVSVLENELKTQFNVDVEGELRSILFYNDYQNDCYKPYRFTDDEEVYDDYDWEDRKNIRIRIRNLVNAYLRDILPDYTRVLIDVSW